MHLKLHYKILVLVNQEYNIYFIKQLYLLLII